VIPQMRGKHRSRKPDSVLVEIRSLVDDGVREIQQETSSARFRSMRQIESCDAPKKVGRSPEKTGKPGDRPRPCQAIHPFEWDLGCPYV